MAQKTFIVLGVLSLVFYGQPKRYSETEFKKLLSYMTRGADLSKLSQERRVEVFEACKDALIKQFPWLLSVVPLNYPYTEVELNAWEQSMGNYYYFTVEPLPQEKLKQLL